MLKLDIQLFADNRIIIEADIDTKRFDAQIRALEAELKTVDERLSNPKKYNLKSDDIVQLTIRSEKLTNQLVDLRAKQQKYNEALEEVPANRLENIQSSIDKIGGSLKRVVGSVTKWGLAIFGVRGAYSLIRNAMSTIANEDQQIATDIQYMKWILAQTIKPVVEWIVQALYTILSLVNSISVSLFSFNFLTGKSADDFKRAKKEIGGMSAGLKEAKKQLAGFDEMNVLQDNTSGGGGGGAGGLDDWTPPDWGKSEKQAEKIKKAWFDIGDTLKKYIEEAPWEAWINGFGLLGITLKGVTEWVYGLWNILTGFVQFVIGIAQTIVGVITGNQDLIDNGVQNIVDGITKIITGFLYQVIGFIHEWVGIILEIGYELVGSTIKIYNDLKNGAFELGKSITTFFYNAGSKVGTWIKERVAEAVNLISSVPGKIKGVFESLVGFFSGLWSRIKNVFTSFATSIGESVSGAFRNVINAVLSGAERILNAPINSINSLIDKINDIPALPNIGRIGRLNLPRLAQGGIVNNPGSGVVMGSYIAGERGPEAVLPLTDDTLQKLASMIPITVNLTNTMNGRVISRELKKVQNENDFAFNR